jgi:hypothetical protein
MTEDQSLRKMLDTIVKDENTDQQQIVAEAINLYLLAIRIRGGRVTMSADDVAKLFTICRILIQAGGVEREFAKITGAPRDREREHV